MNVFKPWGHDPTLCHLEFKNIFQLLFLFHFNEYKMQHMKISELAHLYLRLQSRKKISL